MVNNFSLHHYGFATKSIDKSVEEFTKLGYSQISNKIRDTVQGVDLCFLKNSNDHLLELVSPINGTNGPVSGILQKNGSSLYHICYEVDNLRSVITNLVSNRFLLILPPTPAIAFSEREISFLFNPQLGLIELLQK